MTEAALTPQWRAELAARRGRVRRLLEESGCDVGVIFGCDGHNEHFRYLTNFAPVLGDSWLILGAEERCVLTFQWQIPEARTLSGIERWEGAFDPVPLVRDDLRGMRPTRIGIAGLERMPVPVHGALADGLAARVVDLSASVAGLRRRKSPLEVERLRAAARITDMMLDAARAMARPGVTEAELAAELSVIPLRRGARCAFETTVVSGVDAPVSIRRPTGRALAVGDSVMVDLGAEVEGYQADATRTFVVGRRAGPSCGPGTWCGGRTRPRSGWRGRGCRAASSSAPRPGSSRTPGSAWSTGSATASAWPPRSSGRAWTASRPRSNRGSRSASSPACTRRGSGT